MFWREFYGSFTRVQGWVLAVLGVLLSLATFFWSDDTSIPIGWVATIATVLTILIVTLVEMSRALAVRVQNPLPRVLACLEPSPSTGDRRILLLEPSDLYGHDAVVSVYHARDDGFEVLVALGYVATVQQNGRIQVVIARQLPSDPGPDQVFDSRNATNLRRLLVRPGAPNAIMEQLND